jgi:hypothetical protein
LPAVAAVVVSISPQARAEDVSAPPILQMFESSWKNIENRAPDIFATGYGAMWVPPPGRADQGNQSVGYDVYNRFDLGSAGNPTLYGTKTGLQTTVAELHKIGTSTYTDLVWNHDGFNQWKKNDGTANTGFLNAGGYPGFYMSTGNGSWGDFHDPGAGGDQNGQISGLIDIDQGTNNMYIRNPVGADAHNIPAGTTTNLPDPNNAQFYPDRNGPSVTLFDPINNNNVTIYHFNNASPMSGDAVQENALGLLMRQAQWMVETIGVDGFRIDAAKNFPSWVLSYYDRATSAANARKLLDGSTERVFGFSEIYDSNKPFLQTYIRKDGPSNTNVTGNRDDLDFPLYFAMHDNLTGNGLTNNWNNIKNASVDSQDDGLANNGSQGVAFVQAHDSGLPSPYLGNVAYAYTLMRPGNAIVYFNAHEFGTGRNFPIDGRGDALGGLYGNNIKTLVDIRNTHGRGNYKDRTPAADTKEMLIYERENSALVVLSNRLDAGYDSRTVTTGFAPGTPLLELTGNAANPTVDPHNDFPEVIIVNADSTVNLRVPRNKNPDGVETDKGYFIYGPSGPQGSLTLSNVAQTLPGGTATDPVSNGTTRLADVKVITADNFAVTLKTNKVNLLGSIRDHDADGDNALLSIDSGLDVNGNGTVDFRTPGDYKYGYENFTTLKQPGYTSADNNGTYTQNIDATALSEGYHYIGAIAFRHRDSGPAIFTDWKQTIYVDRLPPVVAIDSQKTFGGSSANIDFYVKSVDKTATSVHTFLNLPANLTDAQILAMVNGNNDSDILDRDIFKRGFSGIPSGNNVLTAVTYEITGNYNIQRLTGINLTTSVGAGLGDVDHNNSYSASDVANAANCFETLLYPNAQGVTNSVFNPSADLNGDGKIDNNDLYLLPARYTSVGATAAATEAHNAILRRGNINHQFGTDSYDITALYQKFGQTYDWFNDLNSDGAVNQSDVDTLVHMIFSSEYGDANLDQSVNALDFNALASNFGHTGAAWAQADFNGDGIVDSLDFNALASHFGFKAPAGDVALGSVVPEPIGLAAVLGMVIFGRRRRRST